MSKHTKIFLCIIVLIAAALRLNRLTDVPPGVNRDEASIGVTAYSLMTTGKDEYGRFLPLSFESFGDWKLPLYIYTAIPFVKLFGLTELAVRLPSALAGVASVAAVYYLAHLLFASESIGLLAAFSLAVMPWHIHISRRIRSNCRRIFYHSRFRVLSAGSETQIVTKPHIRCRAVCADILYLSRESRIYDIVACRACRNILG